MELLQHGRDHFVHLPEDFFARHLFWHLWRLLPQSAGVDNSISIEEVSQCLLMSWVASVGVLDPGLLPLNPSIKLSMIMHDVRLAVVGLFICRYGKDCLIDDFHMHILARNS